MDNSRYLSNSVLGGDHFNCFTTNQFQNIKNHQPQDRKIGYLPRIAEETGTYYYRQPVLNYGKLQQQHHQQGRQLQQHFLPRQPYQQQQSLPQVSEPRLNYNQLHTINTPRYRDNSSQYQLQNTNYQQAQSPRQLVTTHLKQPPQQQQQQQQQRTAFMTAPNQSNPLPIQNMNNVAVSNSAGYNSPQSNIQIPNHQQAYLPATYSPSSYSTSPYSTSPYATSPYSPQQRLLSTPPAQINQNYLPKSNSDPGLSQTLNAQKNMYQGNNMPYQSQYAPPLPADGYRDLLNLNPGVDLSNYTVKLDTGVIHQYPTPDYITNNYNNQQQQQMFYAKNQPNSSEYPPDLTNTYYPGGSNQNLQQDVQSLSQYDQYQSQQQPLYPPQHNNYPSNQYNQMMPQLSSKQNINPSNDLLPPQMQNPNLQQGDTSPNAGYRSTILDSPQGSPLSVQSSPVMFKTPQATPPLQRRQAPARQISNEVYKLDSPSNQLQIHEMSLNSPRPRSETVEMEPPPVPPRSPVAKTENNNKQGASTYPTQSQQTSMSPPSMPPPSMTPAQYTQNVQGSTVNQLQQPQTTYTIQRIRSGTVEMVDSVLPASRTDNSFAKPMPPPNAPRYASSGQLNVTGQRSRAGTVEMLDNQQCTTNDQNQCPPERRIRSGTVEMSEAGPLQAAYYQQVPQVPQPVPEQSQQQQPPTSQTQQQQQQQQSYDNKVASPNTAVTRITYDDKHPTSKQPPPYPVVSTSSNNSSQSQAQEQYTNQLPPQQLTHMYQITVSNGSAAQYRSPPQVIAKQQTSPLAHYSQPQPVVQNKNTTVASPAQQVSNPNVPSSYNIAPSPQSMPRPSGSPNAESQQPSSRQIVNNDAEKNYPTAQSTPPTSNPPLQQYAPSNSRNYQQVPPVDNVGQLSDQELEHQQKMMQQQYVQRVRQAQLQQQLREIQSEYVANLRLEQDIAQEFLQEQKEIKVEPQAYPNHSLQHQRQQQAPMMQQYQSNHPPPRQLNYDPQLNPQYMPQPQQAQPRMPYMPKDGAVFPVTGLPINQPGYQPRVNGQQRQIPSQPIVIMPGGGSFPNPGQFVPSSAGPPPRKDQRPSDNPTPRTQGKQQTPFQRLRKIAEDISSFVDDVVKFKGKKGDHEYKYLEEMLTQQLLLLDKVPANSNDELRNARKALVKEVQELMEILDSRSTQAE